MKAMTKFVVNRDDKSFYYVEKILDRNGIRYRVYFDIKEVIDFNQENFHAIFGADEKISIQRFSNNAIDLLIHGYHGDQNQRDSYEVLKKFSSMIAKDDKNPNIPISQFVLAITTYNQALSRIVDVEFDYAHEYDLVKDSDEALVMGQKITRPHNTHLNYNNTYIDDKNYERGIERRIKYDN